MTTFNGYHVQHRAGADTQAIPLLLLHGTGGDEHDLIDIGRMMAPASPLLGVRGLEKEGAINRWFRRHGEGVFDLPSLETRAAELAAFIEAATAHFGFARPPVALGYSNGANIAAGILMRQPRVLSGAILMRSMAGLSPSEGLSLNGLPVLMLNGANDPFAPREKQALLGETLASLGAEVTQTITAPGHPLMQADINVGREWLAERFSRRSGSLTG
jgi:phospholipase/carboxylesterase